MAPRDLRFVVAAASSDALVGPSDDPRLAWTTNTPEASQIDALVAGVEAHVVATALDSTPFRPLERAKYVAEIISGARGPTSTAEWSLVGAWSGVLITVVAASDDESQDAPRSYSLDDVEPLYIENMVAGPECMAAPRLAEWARMYSFADPVGCQKTTPPPPLQLWQEGCTAYRPSCDGRPIRQSSPGVGLCTVQITTHGGCTPSRGWSTPKSGPTSAPDGRWLCDVLPVAPAAMDACVHDPACPGCGSGWCITEVTRYECPAGQRPPSLRLVGGAVPEDGTLSATCIEEK